ncbi:xylulokinase [uncultured Gilliamella sp.]|uniref:xylulokinase n=1 Tax=uncultured Gilliamella sp. TaxID=1193505 RepID=UPI0025CEDC5B|nr:xylulokinase [uncultured Gilliamella sp.]
MYIGIDLGTSGVKAILMDEQQKIIASNTQKLTISRHHPLWSEQDPAEWWQATSLAIEQLGQQHNLQQVRAIGLSGQMHGAVLLDKESQVLRPAILWNDGRSDKECQELESLVPTSRQITGNLMMAGFTAPKIKWVQKYEPNIFAQIDKVLLPKDYIRFKMTGQFASDMADAAGTMWLDVEKRDWNDQLLQACGLNRQQMPMLFEGNQITGYVNDDIATRWGIKKIPVIAGAGDNAAGAIGVGLYQPGQAMLSLGTSGVYFVVTDRYMSKPEQAIHSFCHALPERWHLMSVMLSCASCLDWACQLLSIKDVPTLFSLIEEDRTTDKPAIHFLPYLSGERTPHNNPTAKGVFWGLTHQHTKTDLAKAVLLGVSYALADCIDVIHQFGISPDKIIVIGGGARSSYWRQLICDISGYKIQYCEGGDVGPALGAAKLAQIACNPDISIKTLLPELPIVQTHQPNMDNNQYHQEQRVIFRKLYQQLQPLMS